MIAKGVPEIPSPHVHARGKQPAACSQCQPPFGDAVSHPLDSSDHAVVLESRAATLPQPSQSPHNPYTALTQPSHSPHITLVQPSHSPYTALTKPFSQPQHSPNRAPTQPPRSPFTALTQLTHHPCHHPYPLHCPHAASGSPSPPSPASFSPKCSNELACALLLRPLTNTRLRSRSSWRCHKS